MPHSHKTLIIVLIACIILVAIFFAFFNSKLPRGNESNLDVVQNQDKPYEPKKLTNEELMSMMETYKNIKSKPVTDKQREDFFRLSQQQNNPNKLTREQLLELSKLYSEASVDSSSNTGVGEK